MVYHVPVLKQENIYLVAHKNEKRVLFGPKNKKTLFAMGHPPPAH